MTDLADLGFKVDTKGIKQGEKALDDLEKSGKNAEKGAKSLSKAYLAAGAVIGAALGKSIAVAIKFEKAMAEVSTLVDTSTVSMDELADSVKGVNAQFGGGLQQQASALYGIISSGAEAGADSTAILTQANKLALGGVTDLETAADGLTSALNAYGAGADEATAFSDTMFVAMKAGKTTIGELSAVVGQTAPIASQLGVSFDELEASIATLTTTGLKTAQAGTQIQAVFTSILKPTSEAATLAKDLGLEFNSQALEAKGLAGFLTDVREKTGGSKDAMAKLFGSVEAVKAVMSLTGQQAETFANILEDMGNKAGETDVAVAKMKDTLAAQWDELIGKVENAGNAVGEFFLPALVDALKVANDLGDAIIEVLDLISKPKPPTAIQFLEKNITETSLALLKLGQAGDLSNPKVKALSDKLVLLTTAAGVLHKDMGILPIDLTKVADKAEDAGNGVKTLNTELKKENDVSAYDQSMQSWVETIDSAVIAEDSLIDKIATLDRWFQDGYISATIYEKELSKLGQGVAETGDAFDVAGDKANEYGETIRVDIGEGAADAIVSGESLADSMKSLWKRMAADWAKAGLSKLFASMFAGGGFDLSGFDIPGLAGGAGVSGLLGGGATIAAGGATVAGGAIASGTVGPAAAATIPSSGLGLGVTGGGVLAAGALAGVAALGLWKQANNEAKREAVTQEALTSNLTGAFTTAETAFLGMSDANTSFTQSLTVGAGIVGTMGTDADLLEAAMQSVGIATERGTDGLLKMEGKVGDVKAITEAFNSEAVDGMQDQIKHQAQLLADMDDGVIRGYHMEEAIDAVTGAFAQSALEAKGLGDQITAIPDEITTIYKLKVENAEGSGNVVINSPINIEAGRRAELAAGGMINSRTDAIIGEAGRELVLPNNVTEFFVKNGVPINSGGSSKESDQLLRDIKKEISRTGDAQTAAINKQIQIAVARETQKAMSELSHA